MMHRPVRVLVLLLTVAVTAGVVWRATTKEQERGRMRMASQQREAGAADAILELADLRSTLYAYPAPGQGIDFWSKRALALLDSINNRLRDLEPAATAANHSLSATLSSLDGLVVAEKRAREAVRQEQPRIAGDIVFTEARDLIDAAARDLADAGQTMARAESAREAGAANEQSLLAGGLIAAWIFALIVLLPIPKVTPPGPVAALAPVAADESVLPLAPAPPVPPVTVEPPTPIAPAAVAPALLSSVAELCTDIGRVADATELGPLLERAAGLMEAKGVVVWLLTPDGQHLTPALAHGYDEQFLGRMGSIPIEAHNLTAAAFRAARATHAPADAEAPGALAVPMLSSSGSTGVLAAELPETADLPRAEGVARVVAAQLAGLFPVVEPLPEVEQVTGEA
jgi:hypothetical protein